jgi:inner membrane protein
MSAEVIWLSLGVVLLILEVATGGFWIGFFGVGAIVTSGAVWLGLAESLNTQLTVFLLASVLSLIGLRHQLKKWMYGAPDSAVLISSVGEWATVIEEIPPKGSGRVTYQGSTWDAESESEELLPSKTAVQIVRQEGTRLFVKAVHRPS